MEKTDIKLLSSEQVMGDLKTNYEYVIYYFTLYYFVPVFVISANDSVRYYYLEK